MHFSFPLCQGLHWENKKCLTAIKSSEKIKWEYGRQRAKVSRRLIKVTCCFEHFFSFFRSGKTKKFPFFSFRRPLIFHKVWRGLRRSCLLEQKKSSKISKQTSASLQVACSPNHYNQTCVTRVIFPPIYNSRMAWYFFFWFQEQTDISILISRIGLNDLLILNNFTKMPF